jgi:RNA polymerase sigma factor (sigma-70 family)
MDLQMSSAELFLNAEETVLVNMSDEEVEDLLESAQNGDENAKDKLFGWSYLTARQYYRIKVPAEKSFNIEDAEDLTSSFFLEFERTLPRLKSATRFTRHVLKQNLKRYLQHQKKRRARQTLISAEELDSKMAEPVSDEATKPWQDWTDHEWHQYRAVLDALKSTDETTQQIISLRLESPPKPYKEIAELLKMAETAIRMRVTRFYGLVRKKYEKNPLH